MSYSMFAKPFFILALLLAAATAGAQTPEAQAQLRAAAKDAEQVLVRGPARIEMQDQATLALPAGDGFVPAVQAARYLRALGNIVDDKQLVGLIVPTTPNSNWVAMVSAKQDGYIRDDDARDWNIDKLLGVLQQSTEKANAGRRERGLAELEVTRWAEPPAYDTSTHRLVWAAVVHRKAQGADTGADSVSYQTLVLGRQGLLSLVIAGRLTQLATMKPVATGLLADIEFHPGKRYEDFSAATDRVAKYGLAALIVGVAAKKIGLLALAAAMVVKFLKVGLLAVAGAAAAFKRFFKRGAKPGAAAPGDRQP
jgi:uncharacterized membrane-anchored protein